MKRLLITVLAAAALLAFVVTSLGAGGEEVKPGAYTVELDNAFGLIEGADVKVAGVRAGQIKKFRIDPKTYRALVDIEIGQRGFGDLRKDVFCESRPQSLIGEYFLDCLPGKSDEKLPPGSTIPVEQTGSTIPADLINNIMRRPYRERFSILIGELGAALAARGPELNETIRRANPALRETDKVLRELAEQRAVIRDLTDNAEDVVVALADKKTEVTRFIAEARDTARASAERAEDIEGQFQRFPTFLRELRPTMRLLGEAADRQRPALANLARSAPLLRTFFDELGPFSEASRPAFRTLAAASRRGRSAVKAGTPRVAELAAFAKLLPEVVTNLAITLEHLDDRRFATEKDPRSPGGQGYTGLEAILTYIFRQGQATNVYDANSYLLKVSAFLDNDCAQYATAETARREDRQYCRAILGPSQPGIDQPDPTAAPQARRRKTEANKPRKRKARREAPKGDGRRDAQPERGGSNDGKPALPNLPDIPLPPQVQKLLDDLGGVTGNTPSTPIDPQGPLLDFLLGS